MGYSPKMMPSCGNATHRENHHILRLEVHDREGPIEVVERTVMNDDKGNQYVTYDIRS